MSLPNSFIISVWTILCPRAKCVRVCESAYECVCAPLSQTDYLPQFPLTSSRSLSIPLPIHTAARCVSQVQSLSCVSLPEETLYLLQLYRVKGIPWCRSFLYSPKGDTLNLHLLYVRGRAVTGAPPRFRPIVSEVCVRRRVTMLATRSLQCWVSGCGERTRGFG